MSAPIARSSNDTRCDPWEPPVWWHDPVRRQNYITHLERANAAMFLEAVSFLHLWKAEIAADAELAA